MNMACVCACVCEREERKEREYIEVDGRRTAHVCFSR